jgi:DNA-binding XRE family transcriptional regulator
MNRKKKKGLEARGWRVGGVDEFLGLSPEESAYVELKLLLSKNLQRTRKHRHLTQHQLAKLTKSSQSRIAKMESGDPSVSLDLLIRSLLVLGATRRHLGRMLASA